MLRNRNSNAKNGIQRGEYTFEVDYANVAGFLILNVVERGKKKKNVTAVGFDVLFFFIFFFPFSNSCNVFVDGFIL